MLPPVNASTAVNYLSATGAEGQGAQAGAVASARSRPVVQAADTLAGLAPEAEKALQRLAELLGSRNVNANDVLTRLATDFARLIGEVRKPDETPQAFANRLADIIVNMKPEARAQAEVAFGLRQFGISALAFASALRNPASPEAARIVALMESPVYNAAEQALKAAISSYEQISAARPEVTAGQRVAANADTRAATKQNSAATAGEAVAEGEEQLSAQQAGASSARANGQGSNAQAAAGGRLLSAAFAAQEQPAVAIATGKGAAAPAASAEIGTAGARTDETQASSAAAKAADPEAKQKIETILPRTPDDGRNGQHTMQVLRGFNVVISNVATLAGEALKTFAAAPGQKLAEALPAAANPATSPQVVTEAAEWQLPEIPSDEIARRAHQAAKAMEGKVIPLFANASAESEADNGAARQQGMAQQMAAGAKAALATGAEINLPLIIAKFPDVIPFAQMPYPPARDGGGKGGHAAPDQQQGGDAEDEAGTDEETMQDQGEREPRPEEPELLEKPFEAEVPLKRNASDADRAFHMYQRFGGF